MTVTIEATEEAGIVIERADDMLDGLCWFRIRWPLRADPIIDRVLVALVRDGWEVCGFERTVDTGLVGAGVFGADAESLLRRTVERAAVAVAAASA